MLHLTHILASLAVAPPCDVSDPNVCDAFCNSQCGFYNVSMGEKGTPHNQTVYRITPKNVTGIANKNTADPAGDLTFVITKKNVTQMCLHYPTAPGCHTDVEGNDLYGQFTIEVDGQWGPYEMCNPADGWDTSDWMCGQECIEPTHAGCNLPEGGKHNGTGRHHSYSNGVECWCDGTNRQDHTVGREAAPSGFETPMLEAGYAPQCASTFTPWGYPMSQAGRCGTPMKALGGKVYATITGWSFESLAAAACKKCTADDECSGWASVDNVTAQLFSGFTKTVDTPGCVGGKRYHSPWEKYGGSWYGVANLGNGYSTNIWYETPAKGECAEGEPLGTNGCTWRLISTLKYANATCVDEKADAAVERHGHVCFDECPKPLNRNTDCYLDCYRNTLMGDASQNITRMPPASMIDAWVHAFTSDDPSDGGCPHVKPTIGPF
jgi:hypothetical protein